MTDPKSRRSPTKLPFGLITMLEVIHSLIDKIRPDSEKGRALRQAISDLNAHVVCRLKGRHWPPPEVAVEMIVYCGKQDKPPKPAA